MQLVAEQKNWASGITDDMVAEEMHAAAVRGLRECARARIVGRSFRAWKKVGAAGLARGRRHSLCFQPFSPRFKKHISLVNGPVYLSIAVERRVKDGSAIPSCLE